MSARLPRGVRRDLGMDLDKPSDEQAIEEVEEDEATTDEESRVDGAED